MEVQDPRALEVARQNAMLKAAAEPRSADYIADELIPLWNYQGERSVRFAVTAKEILAAQRENPRSPEDTLYASPEAAEAARVAATEAPREVATDESPEEAALHETAEPDGYACDAEGCGSVLKTPAGLARHKARMHKE